MHDLLIRQLKKTGLSESSPPSLQNWLAFLERIDRTYQEADQERYLIERSMLISSNEMMELNEKLENAQHIAQLGYWIYDNQQEIITWSKEMHHLIGLDSNQTMPTYQELLDLLHQEDRELFHELVQKSFNEGEAFEIEIRLKDRDGKFRWLNLIANPQKNINGEYYLSGIAMDISKRKQAEEQVKKTQAQLLTSVRRAAMSEVATHILHNIGNILNSTNISIEMIQEVLKESKIKKIIHLMEMMKPHESAIADFILHDQKGKLILPYLINIREIIQQEFNKLLTESSQLKHHIKFIKEIISAQNILASKSSILETVTLSDIINQAILLSGEFQKLNIEIQKSISAIPSLISDKNKLTQIFLNLIQNARESLIACKAVSHKRIDIVATIKNNFLQIRVSDNGVGIAKDNLTKIFSFGFSTKKNGHGFGLHSSALIAQELGGKLHAESKGPNQGASFILTLPLNKTPHLKSLLHEKQI